MNILDYTAGAVQEVVLENISLRLEHVFPRNLICKSDFRFVHSAISDNIYAQFTALLRGVVKEDSESILIPSNSWEHFKLDFFPQILLKYFPVKTRTVYKSWQKIIVCDCNGSERCLVLNYALEKKKINKNSDEKI